MIEYITEFIGTFIFLSIILNVVKNKSNMKEYAPLAIGLGLTGVIQWGGYISGGNFNPAVSLMFYLEDKLSKNDFAGYVGAQLLGAIAAKYFYDAVNNK